MCFWHEEFTYYNHELEKALSVQQILPIKTQGLAEHNRDSQLTIQKQTFSLRHIISEVTSF